MNPATLPRLHSELIALRTIVPEDAAHWHAYLALPGVVEHTSWSIQGPQDLAALIEDYGSAEPGSPIRFAIEEKRTGDFVGTVGFNGISAVHRHAEIAYDLAPGLWGLGLMTAVCRATALWGIEEQKLTKIQATVLDENRRSIRVLEKCGFAREGMLRDYRRVRGTPRDFWMYSLLARDVGAASPAHSAEPGLDPGKAR